ncbi:hypothetical protein [Fervidobacterium thailandense]|uniref:Uncharacterized protein n=1 Tax=Fervidobacterium thailandense TaxID=1008305 RepID=A0A1E3G529_9BACT|nr:hypothetical protein [Fervidobacterium thailandense]ODN31357.1 hypothetical protein A4H02_00925 [Fervidobacterium thailandense]
MLVRGAKWKVMPFFAATLVVVVLVITGCTLPFFGPSFVTEVSNPSAVGSQDPAFAVAILTDPEFINLLEDALELLRTPEVDVLKSSAKDGKFRLTDVLRKVFQDDENEVLNSLIAFLDSLGTGNRRDLLEKMLQYRDTVKTLLKQGNRHQYCVELKGEAKTKLVSFMSQMKGRTLTAPEKLYMDFRDVLLFRLLMEPFIFAYQNREALKEGLMQIRDATGEFEPEDFFVTQFIGLLEYIKNNFDPSNPDAFFTGLATRLNTLAELKLPANELDMMDIFKENVLIVKGMDLFLQSVDLALKMFVELYDYENTQTNEKGHRKDGKVTLVSLGESPETNLLIILPLGDSKPFEDVSDLSKVDFKIGTLTVTQNTKLIEIMRVFDSVIPTGVLIVEIKPKTGQTIEDENTKFLLLRVTFDFPKLNKRTLDFKDNNIGILNGLFTKDKLMEIFNKFANNEIFEMLDLADPFIGLYDITISGTKATIDIDLKLFGKTSPGIRTEFNFEIKNINTVPLKETAKRLFAK